MESSAFCDFCVLLFLARLASPPLRSDEESADALAKATEALPLFREAGSGEGVADALLAIVASQVALGRRAEARGLAQPELKLFEEAGDRAGAAKMRLALSECGVTGDEALRDAEEARDDFRELGLAAHEARACLRLAALAHQAEEGLEAAEAAEQLFQSAGDAKGEASALHSAALLKLRLEDHAEAMAVGQRACSLFQELGLSRLEARARAGLADAALRYRPGEAEARRRSADEAMELAETAFEAFDRSQPQAWALDVSSDRFPVLTDTRTRFGFLRHLPSGGESLLTMGNRDSCLAGCLRKLWPWRRLEGQVLSSDPPDFSLPMYWLAHPGHWPRRVAENLPKTICSWQADGTTQCEATDQFGDRELEAPADLFYLHGTMEGMGNRASIDRYDKEAFQAKSFNTRHQMTIVTAFTSACRAYAPLYRQAAMGGSWDLAYQDVLAAFEQFLSEVGSERPIVLAGHSQGSMHIVRLVKERIQSDPALLSRICAIHAPGMGQWMEPSPLPVDKDPVPPPTAPCVAIWAAASPQADRKWTLIGFMSRGRGFTDFANPCAWTKGEHLGVLLPDEETKLPVLHRGLVQRAEVVEGLLRVHPCPAAESKLTQMHMGHHDYHAYDVHLFWANVRERVKQQVAAFAQHRQS
ncbi:unnamed protein product [Symbiodinium natans]|uniref:DUF3089 domain-containing protein n=1 Tax=Symbiodinium natans TaxID=878477 RepID=A0A812UL60_9DINO|nr:unnamed protein product [Symbiodinium natans]